MISTLIRSSDQRSAQLSLNCRRCRILTTHNVLIDRPTEIRSRATSGSPVRLLLESPPRAPRSIVRGPLERSRAISEVNPGGSRKRSVRSRGTSPLLAPLTIFSRKVRALDGSARRFALVSPVFGHPRRKRVVSIPRDVRATTRDGTGGGDGGGRKKGATRRAKRAA